MSTNLISIDAERLTEYGARAHIVGDDLTDDDVPDVIADTEQTTAPLVAALHAQVGTQTAELATIAHGYGTVTQDAAVKYTTSDENGARWIRDVL